MIKCMICGKELNCPIEFEEGNFDVYCPDCVKKQIDLEIMKLYPSKDSSQAL